MDITDKQILALFMTKAPSRPAWFTPDMAGVEKVAAPCFHSGFYSFSLLPFGIPHFRLKMDFEREYREISWTKKHKEHDEDAYRKMIKEFEEFDKKMDFAWKKNYAELMLKELEK